MLAYEVYDALIFASRRQLLRLCKWLTQQAPNSLLVGLRKEALECGALVPTGSLFQQCSVQLFDRIASCLDEANLKEIGSVCRRWRSHCNDFHAGWRAALMRCPLLDVNWVRQVRSRGLSADALVGKRPCVSVSRKALSILPPLPSLVSLNVVKPESALLDVQPLANGWLALRSLQIDTRYHESFYDHLAPLLTLSKMPLAHSLTELCMRPGVSAVAALHFKEFTRLRYLHVQQCNSSAAGDKILEVLPTIGELEHLSLWENPTANQFECLGQRAHALRTLEIRGCGLGSEQVGALCKLSSLTALGLALSYTPSNDHDYQGRLQRLGEMTNLGALSIDVASFPTHPVFRRDEQSVSFAPLATLTPDVSELVRPALVIRVARLFGRADDPDTTGA